MPWWKFIKRSLEIPLRSSSSQQHLLRNSSNGLEWLALPTVPAQPDYCGLMEKGLMIPIILAATLLLGNGVSFSVQAPADTHFLFVHGASHGAWCWYKVVAVLQEAGFQATALDMVSDGRDKTIADSVTSLEQYAKPLTDYLANVSGQVVLVGHSLGGITISYAMEQYPEKISKAVFVAAFMPLNNQSGLTASPPGMFNRLGAEHVFTFNFANGPSQPPTSLSVNETMAASMLYNQSPAQDVTLGLSLLDPEPYAICDAVLTLTPSRYGSIRRFYLKTDQDNILLSAGLDFIVNQNPPEQVFFVPDSDHCAFFSSTDILTAILAGISYL